MTLSCGLYNNHFTSWYRNGEWNPYTYARAAPFPPFVVSSASSTRSRCTYRWVRWDEQCSFVYQGEAISQNLRAYISPSLFIQASDQAHLHNERIRLRNLHAGRRIVKSLLRELSTQGGRRREDVTTDKEGEEGNAEWAMLSEGEWQWEWEWMSGIIRGRSPWDRCNRFRVCCIVPENSFL